MFFKIADIQGESTDSQHMHEIDVLAFSWGAGATVGSLQCGRSNRESQRAPVSQDFS
jgi:type VI protein secretion system component Hcp